MRSLIAGGMVVAARPMYEDIGVHWTMTLPGYVVVILVSAPYVLYEYRMNIEKENPTCD